jgi:galactokinase
VNFQSSYPKADLAKRLDAFVEENCRIIPAAGEALKAGDFAKFGEAVDLSQAATEKLLGNTIPETVFLAHEAKKLGAIAASAFGAGFGGSVWALVKRSDGDKFVERWMRAYSAEYPEAAMAAHGFCTGPGPAAFEL